MQSLTSGLPQRKRLKTYNKKKIIISLLLTVLGLLIVTHFMIKMRRAYLFSKEIQSKKANMLTELESKSKELEGQLQLYTSPVGQERLLRERYSYAKDGEHEIIIEDGDVEKIEPKKKDVRGFFKRLFRIQEKN